VRLLLQELVHSCTKLIEPLSRGSWLTGMLHFVPQCLSNAYAIVQLDDERQSDETAMWQLAYLLSTHNNNNSSFNKYVNSQTLLL
jgi:hypothetical protein